MMTFANKKLKAKQQDGMEQTETSLLIVSVQINELLKASRYSGKACAHGKHGRDRTWPEKESHGPSLKANLHVGGFLDNLLEL